MSRALAIASAALLAWLAAGCSSLRLAYDNADTYLHYRANSYLDLQGKDSEELDERIDDFFAWHRRNALPRYARLADEAATRISRGLAGADLAWGYDAFLGHAHQGLRAAAERMAPLLDRLTPQQLANMEHRFADDNRRFAREHLRGSEAERRKRRAARVEERLEDWVGNLSSAQLERVRQFSERAPLFDELRSRDRKRMQAELLDMIRRREAQKRLPDWASDWERGRDPAHVAASERFRQEYWAMLLDLDRTLSREQRSRAEAHFRRYAEDLRILARRAPALQQ